MESSVVLPESELFLQWGNRKRNRCARATTKDHHSISSDRSIRRITSNSNFILDRQNSSRFFLTRDDEPSSKLRSGSKKASSSSPENHYATRGSVVNGTGLYSCKKKNINSTAAAAAAEEEISKSVHRVWPKLYLGLSNKEKEEDFMAMKGCKPPHRPKKRPKAIQRSVLLVCPGGWLADMCQERYEVREKKSSKKRPRGLKGMGSLETDSE